MKRLQTIAAEKLGKGSEYLQTARNIELPMHDPRLAPGYARTYQYDPPPGRHVKGGLGMVQMSNPDPAKYNYENTGEADYSATVFSEVLDCAGLCLFITLTGQAEAIPKLLEAVTGIEPQEAMAAGARVLNMRQAFNVREGLRPSDFNIPLRSVGKPPLEKGPTANCTVDNEKLGDNFFAAVGWDRTTGKPYREVLERLGGMDDVIADLYN
ncbi:aldehyde ferredoxin oxidoreductase C-terminal domain-containing protein [Calorimonas adulescens]|uniref:aldehyde ferredoxin oxidoreductase C-terminal domain-containing protein n=1 Tax=Calorimonas adulescens TaxID=2606906 RepID=UPI001396C5CA|nr:aldehyde ferredoxin oxidoreductase C-terminal domain-containing protein [Calorimonas adulescens]